MRNKISRLLPPGYPARQEAGFYLAGVVCGLLYSLTRWAAYASCWRSLWEYTAGGTRTEILSGTAMPEFTVLFGRSFLSFEVFALLSLTLILFHYRYYYQGSRSIYLMRRLPDAWELHRQCLTLPVLMAVSFLVCAALLAFVYYGIYRLLTPEQALSPESFQTIWRVLL